MHMQFAEPTQSQYDKEVSVTLTSETIEQGNLSVITQIIS